ncbi:ATP/GTP-binding protein [Streptomyces sp. NPDC057445]|uniref:ATP/GTP-binding protein n=1 Tax=Streptomyces sp. NPDC057445 TaxID=3346136 RepID=UPI00369FA64E
MSDDPNGILLRFPGGGDPSYVPPPIPAYTDTLPAPEDIPEAPPEETTIDLPPIPHPMDPSMALSSEGISIPEPNGEYGEDEYVEYVQPRSLADRIGDWLEFRIDMARARHESEAPFREAEIARKAALLGARTAQEVALIEQNGKLRQALLKARGDKAEARGKAEADRVKSTGSGLGSGKGRSKAGTGGASRSGTGSGPARPKQPRGGANTAVQAGRTGPKSPGKGGGGSGSRGPVKGAPKGAGRPPASSTPGPGRSGADGRSKGWQAGSGRGGRGKRNGVGKTLDPHRPGHRPWRDSGSKSKPPPSVGPWKAKPENKPAAKGGGKPSGKAETGKKSEAARPSKSGRLPAGTVIDPHKPGERPWKSRPKASKGVDGTVKETSSEDAPDAAADGRKAGTAPDEPDGTEKARHGPSDGPGKDKPSDPAGASTKPEPGPDSCDADSAGTPKGERLRDRWRRSRERSRGRTDELPGLVPADSLGITVERTDHHNPDTEDKEPPQVSRPALSAAHKDEAGAAEQPTRPHDPIRNTGTGKSSVNKTEVTAPSRQGGLATQHRTDISFDQYLVEMVNVAISAAAHQERAEALAEAFATVADALRGMAADLVDDHNIDTRVTDLITELADSAGRLKLQARRCAEECGIASEAAMVAAADVARVYGQDMDARDDAGLASTSAAAHHD